MDTIEIEKDSDTSEELVKELFVLVDQNITLQDPEKAKIISDLYDIGEEEIYSPLQLFKSLGYTFPNTFKLGAMSPNDLVSCLYLHSVQEVDIDEILEAQEFHEPIERVREISNILAEHGVSIQNALTYHPELLSQSNEEVEKRLQEEESKDMTLNRKLLDELEQESGKERLPQSTQRYLFNKLNELKRSLRKEASVQPNIKRITDILVVRNHGLVGYVANMTISQEDRTREKMEDAVSVGEIGLIMAVRKYDPTRGPFSTYAVPAIQNAIIRDLYRNPEGMYIPQRMRELVRQYHRVENTLMQKNKESQIPFEEVARAMGLGEREADALLAALRITRPLKVFDEDWISHKAQTIEGKLLKKENLEELKTTLRQILTPEELAFIIQRYPVDSYHHSTQQETAARYGISRQAIQQREHKILKKLADSGLLQRFVEKV
jgi:RNA polymerase sigma factor (sigma-70 family)